MQQGHGCVTLLHLMKSNVSVLLCSFKPILEYIDTQFEKYLEEELKIKRSLFSCHDSRIHACLYFIAPSGHSLKSLDLVTMKKLDSKVTRQSIEKQRFLCPPFFPRVFYLCSVLFQIPPQVNIIPVIAKADTVNRSELDKLKIKIMSELVSNGVQIYQFPTEDEAVAEINSSMNVSPSSRIKTIYPRCGPDQLSSFFKHKKDTDADTS